MLKSIFVKSNGYCYPKDAVLTIFTENDYLDQYRDLKIILIRLCRWNLIESIYILLWYEKGIPLSSNRS